MTVETFTDADGTSLATHNANFVVSNVGTATTTIQSNALRERSTAGSYSESTRWYRSDISIAQVNVVFKQTVANPKIENYPEWYLRGSSSWGTLNEPAGGATSYSCTLQPNANQLDITTHTGSGSFTTRKQVAFTATAGHQYGVHLRAIGGLIWTTYWDITNGDSESSGAVHLCWYDAAALKLTAGTVMHAVEGGSAAGNNDNTLDDLDITTNVPLHPYPVQDRGTLANTTGATTSVVTITSPTTVATGNYLFMRIAVDNSGTNGAEPGITSIVDSRSNAWTVITGGLADPGAANAGSQSYFAYAKVATAYQAADTITVTWTTGSPPAKAIVVEEWANVHATSPIAVTAVTSTGATTTVTTGAITPTAANQLVYAITAAEAPDADTITYDTDNTAGGWFELTALGSTNATATNNQKVYGQAKVATGTSAQTLNQTLGTTRDWCGLVVVIAAAAADQNLSLTGPTVAITAGTLQVNEALALTGPTVTITPGTTSVLNATQNLSLTGPTVVVTAGSVSVFVGVNLIGPTVQIFPGTLSLAVNLALTGPTVAITPGATSVRLGLALTGPTVAITAGSMAVTVGDTNLALTGPTVAITAGTLSVQRAGLTFSPPTINIPLAPPFERWHGLRGQTVYRLNGVWHQVSDPYWDDIKVADIAAASSRPCGEQTDGTDRDRYLFIGGHLYPVSDAIAAELLAAGYGANLS